MTKKARMIAAAALTLVALVIVITTFGKKDVHMFF